MLMATRSNRQTATAREPPWLKPWLLLKVWHSVACCAVVAFTTVHVNSATNVAEGCYYYIYLLFALQRIAASQARAVLSLFSGTRNQVASPGCHPARMQSAPTGCPVPGD